MHKSNLIIVVVSLALCLPFLRLLTVPLAANALPTVHTPSR